MNIKIAKFHQPLNLAGKNLTTVNLSNKSFGHMNKYGLTFQGGLVRVEDKEAGEVAYTGLANVVYMIEDVKKQMTKKEALLAKAQELELELTGEETIPQLQELIKEATAA